MGIGFTQIIPKTKNVSDWEYLNLNGKVKSIEETIKIYFNENNFSGITTLACYDFNDKGYLTEMDNCAEGEERKMLEINIYNNDKMQLIKSISNENFTDFEVTSEYKYDSNGNLTESISHYETSEGNNWTQKSINEYNGKGFISKSNTFDENNSLTGYTVFEYDNNNNLSQMSTSREDDIMIFSITSKNNDRGNPIEIKTTSSTEPTTTITSEYKGFDKYGNWIEKIDHLDFGDGFGKTTTERKITYYD